MTNYVESQGVVGGKMYSLMERLFPITRSLTGEGVRESLRILGEVIPLENHEVRTGQKAFDWMIPKEWNIRSAYIEDVDGTRIVDMKDNNLHVVGYSVPVDAIMPLEELLPRVFSLPDHPEWIPYVTSYYKETWGFCMEDKRKASMRPGPYHVVIDSRLDEGVLNYADLVIKGESKDEILLSSYICHPSMANNELSGPVILSYLARWILSLPNRKWTYRIVIAPETIGAIHYISQNYEHFRERVLGGFVLSTIGDAGDFSYVASRYGDAISDEVTERVLKKIGPYKKYSFKDRGSDERQYNSPGVNLGVVTLTRSKFGTYPEYHTSADNMELITPEELEKSLEAMKSIISEMERERIAGPYEAVQGRNRKSGYYELSVPCEPQLGKRGLYPTLSQKGNIDKVRNMMDFLAYADGTNSPEEISERTGIDLKQVFELIELFSREGIIRKV